MVRISSDKEKTEGQLSPVKAQKRPELVSYEVLSFVFRLNQFRFREFSCFCV